MANYFDTGITISRTSSYNICLAINITPKASRINEKIWEFTGFGESLEFILAYFWYVDDKQVYELS